jgi:hypothetical protein
MGRESLAQRGIREIASQPAADELLEGAGASPQPSLEGRHARIAEIAYRHAGERGFAPGGELDDWLAAEREVMVERTAAGAPP